MKKPIFIVPMMIALFVQCRSGETPIHAGVRIPSFIIDAVKGVGPLTPECTEKDLADFYGSENLRRNDIYVGEGETVAGTTLFPDSPNALQIEWKNSYQNPGRLTIFSPGTQWKTSEGITVGTASDQIEILNGGPFTLAGFGWDCQGRTLSWGNGKLPEQLQLDLAPTQEVTAEEEDSVLGDKEFLSDHPVMKKKKLVVKTIFIRWD